MLGTALRFFGYLRAVLLRPIWVLIALGVSAIGNLETITKFLPAAMQRRVAEMGMIQDWPWYVWTIALLSLVVLAVIKSGYSLYRVKELEIAALIATLDGIEEERRSLRGRLVSLEPQHNHGGVPYVSAAIEITNGATYVAIRSATLIVDGPSGPLSLINTPMMLGSSLVEGMSMEAHKFYKLSVCTFRAKDEADYVVDLTPAVLLSARLNIVDHLGITHTLTTS